MASKGSKKIETLAKQGVDWIKKLEKRRDRTSQEQKDFLKLYASKLEIVAAAQLASDAAAALQRPPADSGNQDIVVRVTPDYEIAISSDGTTLKILKLPPDLSTPGERAGTGKSKLKKAEEILKFMLAYGREHENLEAGCADVPGATRALRCIIFSGPGEEAGDLAEAIDDFYEKENFQSSPEFRNPVAGSDVSQALVGSSIGSIVPRLLLENSPTSSVPRIFDIKVRREKQLAPIRNAVVYRWMDSFNQGLETVQAKLRELVKGDYITLKELQAIVDVSNRATGEALEAMRAIKTFAEEQEAQQVDVFYASFDVSHSGPAVET